jgi:DNA-binding FadR family transcriptional regulator
MSAFNNYEKDQIVESISDYIESEKSKNPDILPSDLLRELMETISYGITIGFFKIDK